MLAVWCHRDKFCLLVVVLHKLLTVGANPFSTKPQKRPRNKNNISGRRKKNGSAAVWLAGECFLWWKHTAQRALFPSSLQLISISHAYFLTCAGRPGGTSHWGFWISPGGMVQVLTSFHSTITCSVGVLKICKWHRIGITITCCRYFWLYFREFSLPLKPFYCWWNSTSAREIFSFVLMWGNSGPHQWRPKIKAKVIAGQSHLCELKWSLATWVKLRICSMTFSARSRPSIITGRG